MGVVIAVIAVIISRTPEYLKITYPAPWMGQAVSAVVFSLLGWYLFSMAAKSRKKQ